MTEIRLAFPKTQNIPVFIVKTRRLVTHQRNEMQISTDGELGMRENPYTGNSETSHKDDFNQ